ncbi:hypothetical protein FV141_03550 [Dermacoccus abyssi]|uniref:TerB family tellurite resistance protein n=1 Tax=Dermacoccus abyssi TaxID=322596 RepID=A0ABX5Z6Z3_9MICO|nr:hypothetical protein FV141_03550 [Dermacoccus abyssi]
MAKTPHHEELLWATWLVIQADGKVAEEEKLLLHHVTSSISDRNPASVALVQLRETIDADEAEVLAKFEPLDGDLQPLYECAVLVAGIDGKKPARTSSLSSTALPRRAVSSRPHTVRQPRAETSRRCARSEDAWRGGSRSERVSARRRPTNEAGGVAGLAAIQS